MKIALNMGQSEALSNKDQMRDLERIILAAKNGDWDAKNNLAQRFTPLLTSLAEKRSKNAQDSGKLIEAGKAGLQKAVRKYRKSVHPEKFQVFALDFIEREMTNVLNGGGSFFSRMFGS